jgi:hypothetical protein
MRGDGRRTIEDGSGIMGNKKSILELVYRFPFVVYLPRYPSHDKRH